MAWIIGLMAAAVGLATSARRSCHRARTQISQGDNLSGQAGAPVLKGFQGTGNRQG